MLTLLQISSTRVFLKTLLTTTDSQRLLSLICFFWGGGGLSKSIKVHLTISLRKQMDWIKKIKTFSLASSSPHFLVQDICCIFVLGTWVTRWKEKKQSTSQSIIGALQNIPSVGQMKRTQACWIRKTHTHMHAKFLAHEGNQNVEIPRASNPIQHTFKPRVCVLCA